MSARIYSANDDSMYFQLGGGVAIYLGDIPGEGMDVDEGQDHDDPCTCTEGDQCDGCRAYFELHDQQYIGISEGITPADLLPSMPTSSLLEQAFGVGPNPEGDPLEQDDYGTVPLSALFTHELPIPAPRPNPYGAWRILCHEVAREPRAVMPCCGAEPWMCNCGSLLYRPIAPPHIEDEDDLPF